MATTRSLFRQRDFRVLLTSQGVSALGDAITFTALPLLVLQLTGSGLAMGVVGALQTIPDFAIGMLAGAIADRSDRKRLMLLADLGRALLTALIPLSVLLGGPTLLVILLVAAPMSTLRSFFLSAYISSVPALVGREQLGRANAIFEGVYAVGWVLGPALAGLLAATIGPGLTLAIDAVSFGLSACALFFVRTDLRAPMDRPRASLVADIREGITYVAGHSLLRSIIVFWAIISIVIASLVNVLAVHITRDLRLDETILGLILTAYGVGTIGGSVVLTRIERPTAGPLVLGGTIVTGTMLCLLAATSAVPLMLVGALVAGIAQTVVLVTYITVRTQHSPDELLGRVGSTARTLSLGLQPLGLLAGGALVDLTDGSTTILVMGAALVALAVVASPLRVWRLPTRPSSVPA